MAFYPHLSLVTGSLKILPATDPHDFASGLSSTTSIQVSLGALRLVTLSAETTGSLIVTSPGGNIKVS